MPTSRTAESSCSETSLDEADPGNLIDIVKLPWNYWIYPHVFPAPDLPFCYSTKEVGHPILIENGLNEDSVLNTLKIILIVSV